MLRFDRLDYNPTNVTMFCQDMQQHALQPYADLEQVVWLMNSRLMPFFFSVFLHRNISLPKLSHEYKY